MRDKLAVFTVAALCAWSAFGAPAQANNYVCAGAAQTHCYAVLDWTFPYDVLHGLNLNMI